MMSEPTKGVLAVAGACAIWGLSPIYYVELSHVTPIEVLAQRTLWGLVTFALVLALQRRLHEVPRALSSPRRIALTAAAAAMVSVNWFLFIFAIGAGRTVEASLGYYIFPLVAVAIGAVVLREPLGTVQKIAVAMAMAAVLVLTWGLGVAPWISLALACTFGVYGLLKRWVEAGPVVSVTAEVLLFLPLSLGYLIWLGQDGHVGQTLRDSLLLIGAGPLTAIPLIMFSYAAKRTSMTTMGLVQYLNPSLQFFVAVVILHETVTGWHMLTFPIIWAALALYSWASLRPARTAPVA